MNSWARSHASDASANDLNYGGGIDGIGVTTGHEKVYLVFYGSQWGTQSTNSNGDVVLSGDPSGEAPYAQEFLKGLGTGGELWSGVMTQYCDGVAVGAQTCPASNTEHVAYPTGGALAGVWVDESTASPQTATGHQLGVEAVNAAAHFGNTTAASNRDSQYVILSPTGTNPDNWLTNGFCAWHDYNGDSTLSGGPVTSPYGDIAFTNLPYITDAGAAAGRTSSTPPAPSTACPSWRATSTPRPSPTRTRPAATPTPAAPRPATSVPGSLPAQPAARSTSPPARAPSRCRLPGRTTAAAVRAPVRAATPIVTNPGNTVTVTNPGNQTGTVGTAVSLQIHATDSASGQTLTYSATGLPAGLSINSSSGLITGTPTTAGSNNVTVTATDTTNASGSASFTWTVSSTGGGGCTAAQLLGNPGFETGSAAPWTATAGVINNSSSEPAHSGSWDAWLDGYGAAHTDTLTQGVTVPTGCANATLSYWLHIDTAKTGTTAADTLKVEITSGSTTTTLATYSNLNAASGYTQHSVNLAAYIGKAITVKFIGTENSSSQQTSFVLDDTALNVS